MEEIKFIKKKIGPLIGSPKNYEVWRDDVLNCFLILLNGAEKKSILRVAKKLGFINAKKI
jgi:hypothetical protein